MKKLLAIMLILCVSAGSLAGFTAYYTDSETSHGNMFTAGSLDLKVGVPSDSGQISANPDQALDKSDKDYAHMLDVSELAMLASDDGYPRYENGTTLASGDQKSWPGSYYPDVYLEFRFANNLVPDGAIITAVEIEFDWQWMIYGDDPQIEAARLQIGHGTGDPLPWKDYPLSLPPYETDRMETLDIFNGGFGINTPAKLNALVVRFQAHDGDCKNMHTRHDFVQVNVEYGIPDMEWVEDPDVPQYFPNGWEPSEVQPGDGDSFWVPVKNFGECEGVLTLSFVNNLFGLGLDSYENGVTEPESNAGDPPMSFDPDGELADRLVITASREFSLDPPVAQTLKGWYEMSFPPAFGTLSAGEEAKLLIQWNLPDTGTLADNLTMTDSVDFSIVFILQQIIVVQLVNPGFETGDFTGWSTAVPPGASASVVAQHTGDQGKIYDPVEGDRFALLKTDGPGSLTKAYQDFDIGAGQTLSGWAAFDYRDYYPWNDCAQVRILQGGTVIATPWDEHGNDHSNFWDGPWTSWSWTAPSNGTYTLELSITNSGDSFEDSYALFDAHVIT